MTLLLGPPRPRVDGSRLGPKRGRTTFIPLHLPPADTRTAGEARARGSRAGGEMVSPQGTECPCFLCELLLCHRSRRTNLTNRRFARQDKKSLIAIFYPQVNFREKIVGVPSPRPNECVGLAKLPGCCPGRGMPVSTACTAMQGPYASNVDVCADRYAGSERSTSYSGRDFRHP